MKPPIREDFEFQTINEKNQHFIWGASWAIFVIVALSNFIVATDLTKSDKNVFAEIGPPTFDKFVENIKSGQSSITSDTIIKALIDEHNVVKTSANLIKIAREVLQNTGYAISIGVLLQLYGVLRLRPLNTASLTTAKTVDNQ